MKGYARVRLEFAPYIYFLLNNDGLIYWACEWDGARISYWHADK